MRGPAPAAIILALVAAQTASGQSNKVTFDNQSGEPALVKLIGPTFVDVEVPAGGRRTVAAAAGRYHIKIRYGAPGRYRFAKGDEFDVTETSTTRSETTITIHKVIGGNYSTRPISEDEFGSVDLRKPRKAGPTSRSTQAATQAGPGKHSKAGPWQLRVTGLAMLDSYTFQPPAGVGTKVEMKPRAETKVVVMTVCLTPLRKYVPTERELLEKNTFAKAALRLAKAFDADKIATNAEFFVGCPDSGTPPKLKVHPCEFLRARSGSPNGIALSNTDPMRLTDRSIAVFSRDDSLVLDLVFNNWPIHQKPTLFFFPSSNPGQVVIVTITSHSPEGSFAAEYGGSKDIRELRTGARGREGITGALEYHTLTEEQSREYTSRAIKAWGAPAGRTNATGFLFLGNLYDSNSGTMLVDDAEIAKVREVCKRYSHEEMAEPGKRAGLLKDLLAAIGEEKLRRMVLTILVNGRAKYTWPPPADQSGR